MDNPFIRAKLINGKVGGSIVLKPGQISEPIQTVTWRHKVDLTSKGSWQDIKSCKHFKRRCDFDKTSGSLTINSLTLEDSGSYIAEINNKVLEKKKLQVIKPVPKPTVSIKCNKEKTSYSLTCEAQVTADFGPVTYKWKTGDTELSTDKELLITTENKESSFFCELVNPVSSCSSEIMDNPFIRAELINGKVGGSIVLKPGLISEPTQTLIWRHKVDLTSKGFWEDIKSCKHFKGRCDFDETSGRLTINSLTLEDSGSYIVEINNKVLKMKELQVIITGNKKLLCRNKAGCLYKKNADIARKAQFLRKQQKIKSTCVMTSETWTQ
ncbi:T-lymphocyte surface antigen Ly-9-like [Cyprinodon tularosa]|uniref:T-lymphocyte surface antigen Ly-9-like n=1 Tax=Cyprinodon tularosa TaxID=77115 RepID=UPI0018E2329D|nr:T-lymphocyte surface antigen Ly-9-like [Cyprinodon tularosa]